MSKTQNRITDLSKLLNIYNPDDQNEKIYKAQMLDFLDKYDNNFSRDQEYGHFTGSSLLLNSDCTHFMLMHHKKIGIWLQLGGHCDGESDVLLTSIKEAQEESGINEIEFLSDKIFDIDVHKFPAMKNLNEHFHFDVRFLLKTVGNDKIIVNEESHDVKWFALDKFEEIKSNFEHSINRMVNKYLNMR